jgi:hypothetical protein
VNLPLNDSFAVRLVGFYSLEGGYVDNVLAPSLMGDTTNADVVEDDWNDAEVYGGRIAARWLINPKWETTLSFVIQDSSNTGTWETDGDVGDYKTTRFFDEYLDDDWWQTSLNVKGDLGFAELSSGLAFRSQDQVQWITWSTTSTVRPTATPLRHWPDLRHLLQQPEADKVLIRSPAYITGREPFPMDGRCVLREGLRLVA